MHLTHEWQWHLLHIWAVCLNRLQLSFGDWFVCQTPSTRTEDTFIECLSLTKLASMLFQPSYLHNSFLFINPISHSSINFFYPIADDMATWQWLSPITKQLLHVKYFGISRRYLTHDQNVTCKCNIWDDRPGASETTNSALILLMNITKT